MTKQFKEITQKLWDLADEFDHISKSISIPTVNNSKKISRELSGKLDIHSELYQSIKPLHKSFSSFKKAKFARNTTANLKLLSHEIKEELNEGEEEAINLNLCQVNQRNSWKQSSLSSDTSSQSDNDNKIVIRKESIKSGEKKKKKRKLRKIAKWQINQDSESNIKTHPRSYDEQVESMKLTDTKNIKFLNNSKLFPAVDHNINEKCQSFYTSLPKSKKKLVKVLI